jgi:hypothetical protein
MANRLQMLHDDILRVAQHPSRAKKISNKFSHWAHHIKIRKIVLVFTGIAIGIALGVVTAGAGTALVATAAIAFAGGQANNLGGWATEKYWKKRAKRKLKSGNLDAAGEVKKRAYLMSMERGDFERNFQYFTKHVRLLRFIRENSIKPRSCREAFEYAKEMYGSLIYHDDCEKYFGMYELFMESVFSAMQQIVDDFNDEVDHAETYIKYVVALPTSEHVKNCRKSRFQKDTCYGMQAQSAKGALNDQIRRNWETSFQGPPHKRAS